MTHSDKAPTAEQVARNVPEAARTCGDLLDDFPCIQCGAKSPSGCPLTPPLTIPAGEALNRTIGLGNLLRRRVAKMRAQSTEKNP
jgi:hypothetical protein